MVARSALPNLGHPRYRHMSLTLLTILDALRSASSSAIKGNFHSPMLKTGFTFTIGSLLRFRQWGTGYGTWWRWEIETMMGKARWRALRTWRSGSLKN